MFPNSDRCRELASDEFGPPQLLPLAPLDAPRRAAPVEPLRRPFGHPWAISEPRRRLRPRRRRVAGEFDPVDR